MSSFHYVNTVEFNECAMTFAGALCFHKHIHQFQSLRKGFITIQLLVWCLLLCYEGLDYFLA